MNHILQKKKSIILLQEQLEELLKEMRKRKTKLVKIKLDNEQLLIQVKKIYNRIKL
jgi:hypothetical protein